MAIVATLAGCQKSLGGAAELRRDTFPVGDSPSVVVDSTNGRIEVVAGRDGEIDVRASIRQPHRMDYRVVESDGAITVTAEPRQNRFEIGDSPSADITITAPPNTSVDLRTSNGRIEVRDIQHSGRVRTTNGRIVLDNVKGGFEARTTNGSIDFSGEMTPGSNNELRTSNGMVSISFTGEPNISLDAATSNGSVTSKWPVTATRTETTHLSGTIGAGEAELIVRTSNGSVTIQ